MELTRLTTEPILVKNPHTGRLVDVAPLFDAMQEFDGGDPPGSPMGLRKAITRVIRYVNLGCNSSEGEAILTSMNFDLYRLEDMFEEIKELK